ncbi:MAG: DUF2608 domain-containing protein [Holosporales bacterium]|jgi:hypothetical protein|nr:DUF2608 domain-containing protein [Holosporales bacterium]
MRAMGFLRRYALLAFIGFAEILGSNFLRGGCQAMTVNTPFPIAIHTIEEILPIVKKAAETGKPVVLFDIDYTLTRPLFEKSKKDSLYKYIVSALRAEFGKLLNVSENSSEVTQVLKDLLGTHGDGEMLAKLMKELNIDKKALKRILREVLSFAAVTYFTQALIDQNAPKVIQEIQQQHIPCYGFTALSAGACGTIPSLGDWRLKELAHLEIVFSPFPGQGTGLSLCKGFLENAWVQGGVIFAGGEDQGQGKGKVLRELLQRRLLLPQGEKPSVILMIDDNEANLESMSKISKEFSIPFLGLQYKGGEQHCAYDRAMLKSFIVQLVSEFMQK